MNENPDYEIDIIFAILDDRIIALGEKILAELHIPEYSGQAYTVVNDNVPFFDRSEMVTYAFEEYSPLDVLGR